MVLQLCWRNTFIQVDEWQLSAASSRMGIGDGNFRFCLRFDISIQRAVLRDIRAKYQWLFLHIY